MKKKLHVLFAAFEADPFLKTGGLGDVAGSLPPALNKAGCEVRVILPKFGAIEEKFRARMKHVTDFRLQLGWRDLYCGVERLTHHGVTFYFVDNEYYFQREKAYGYYDDGERIAFFAKAVAEAAGRIDGFRCDILHCNDWHTALTPVFLRECYCMQPQYARIATVFTIHNLKFQGIMPRICLSDILGLQNCVAARDQLCVGDTVNYMRGALCYADALTTVSPTYATEIRTPYYGEGLSDVFLRRADSLTGILNGIDTQEYDPAHDAHLPARFAPGAMSGKRECKLALQQELGLEVAADKPLIVLISRLTEQKGLDLVTAILEELLLEDVQIAILGVGDAPYERFFREMEQSHKGAVCADLQFSAARSHRFYAAGDLLLMPSRFEPCGLSQMIAMRYGTLPVVRETGGLCDTVQPYNQFTGAGNGFSFCNFNAHELLFTLRAAISLYRDDRAAFDALAQNAMAADFSWDGPAQAYLALYERLGQAE